MPKNIENATQQKVKKTGSKDHTSISDKNSAKKAIVLGTEKKNRNPWLFFLIPAMIIAGISTYVVVQKIKKPLYTQTQLPIKNTFNQITYPVVLFQDGKAHYFEYKAEGTSVRYFILRSSDGIIRAAFDACDVCWPAGKGYFQNGDNMVCRNCGKQFASIKINEIKGGCNPAPLKRTIKGGQLVLQEKDILDGKPYFNFSGRI